MTVGQFLAKSSSGLKNAGISSYRLDTLVLLEHVTKIDRSKLLAEPERKLSEKEKNLLNKYIALRTKRIPITQLLNKAHFYGREFYVNEFVMSPRPETETMIDMFLDIIKTEKSLKSVKNLKVVDIGTGSGAIGIAVKKEVPDIQVTLIDNDSKALLVAEKNVVLHTISIRVINNNLLQDITDVYHVILANLPYVPDAMEINEEAKNEPREALFAGPDGLEIYKQLFKQLKRIQNKPLLILIESFPFQHDSISKLAAFAGYKLDKSIDFVQAFLIS